jgi:hypothetical protein
MYYRLDMSKAEQNTFVRSVSHRAITLTSGQPLDTVSDLPFKFEMEVTESYDQFDPDFEGEPEQGTPEPRVYAYYRNVSLMHHSMVDALRGAGVDNIQSFPAVITLHDPPTEFRDHMVVNVIGVVSCANLSASESEPLGELNYFLNLVIDPARTKGLRLFRLAEYPPEILVDEQVASVLRKGQFEGLTLEPVAEATGS